MPQPRSTPLLRIVVLATLLLLPACGERASSPTATTIGAQSHATPASPTHLAPPGTPGTPLTVTTPSAPTPSQSTHATPSTIPALATELAATQRIRIAQNYSGHQIASWQARWDVQRVGEQFTGQARFIVDPVFGPERSAAPSIAIPPEVGRDFLEMLGGMLVQPGSRNLIRQTEITLDTPSGSVEIFYETFGGFAPVGEEGAKRSGWSMIFSSGYYIIESDVPERALAVLDPHLRKDVLSRLLAESNATPTPRTPLLCTLPSAAPSANRVAPTPTSMSMAVRPTVPVVGESVNIVTWLGIANPTSITMITIEDGADFAKKTLTDAGQIRVLLDLLDKPLPVIPSTTFHANERIGIDIATADLFSTPLYYLPRAELIFLFDPVNGPDYRYSVQAPPELRAMLIGIFCGP